MPLVLIEPDVSLRTLFHCLFVQQDLQVNDFATATDALGFIQTSPVVLTVLSVTAGPPLRLILDQTPARHMPVLIALPATLVVQLLRVQQQLEALLDAPLVSATLPTIYVDVTPAQWAQIVVILPPPGGKGRPRAIQYDALNGVLWVVRTRSAWHLMPKRYGNYVTCWRYWHQWQRDGTWPQIEALLIPGLPLDQPA